MRRRESLKLLGILATVGTAAWLGRDYTPVPALLAQQRSSTGEQRRFQLDDGSLIQLNSDSAVDSDFDPQRRLIILRRGEIIVNVGTDQHSPQARPFWVQSRDGIMRAQSSRFLARELDDGTLVAAQEGSVTVFPAPVKRLRAALSRQEISCCSHQVAPERSGTTALIYGAGVTG